MIYFSIPWGAIDCTDLPDVSVPKQLVSNTVNTWQKERGVVEKNENSNQGKVAEAVFYEYLCSIDGENQSVSYRSYDEIRKDHFLNAAPCDGILWRKDLVNQDKAESLIQQIADWSEDAKKGGHLPKALRKELRDNQVYLVEIKSTKVRENQRARAKDVGEIVENIRKSDDYFTYPALMRVSLEPISFEEYAQNALREKKLSRKELLEKEFLSSSDIVVRIYFDNSEKENHAYIIGYVRIEEILDAHDIRRFPSKKSAKALYYALSLEKGHPISELSSDSDLWGKTI